MSDTKCFHCKHWEYVGLTSKDGSSEHTGECRRYPPAVHPRQLRDADKGRRTKSSVAVYGLFPYTLGSHWCGEFKQ